jgi:RNA polymerase sigma factor (TIGR02999 family)
MRRILIDQARRIHALRRGKGKRPKPLDQVEAAIPEQSQDILAINDVLERFEKVAPLKAKLVKLRYFAGLTIPQVAAALGISTTTADRYWAYARAWLHAKLKKSGGSDGA